MHRDTDLVHGATKTRRSLARADPLVTSMATRPLYSVRTELPNLRSALHRTGEQRGVLSADCAAQTLNAAASALSEAPDNAPAPETPGFIRLTAWVAADGAQLRTDGHAVQSVADSQSPE